MSQPPTKNKARSGTKNRFYHGSFEYHICFQVDLENPDWFDDLVVLRSSRDDAYESVVSVHEGEGGTEETVRGASFVTIKFEGVKPRKHYDCYLVQDVQQRGKDEPTFFLFRDRYLTDGGARECELDALDE